MSLSTLEMISTLRIGQIAKCIDVQEYSYGVKIIDDGFYWIDSKGIISDIFSLSSEALKYRWKILQEYVHISKAIEAFLQGEKIYSYDSEGDLCNIYDPVKDENSCISISEILYCYWSIESREG